MRKFYLLTVCALLCATIATFQSCQSDSVEKIGEDEENEEGYDGPEARNALEVQKTIDPSLGYVPYTLLQDAVDYTIEKKAQLPTLRTQQMLLWQERGPIFDSIGPSNGNSRAGVNYTAGRMRAILVDTLNDPTGNTVVAGGVAGGIWRCTNFLSDIPNWTPMNDYMDNLSISYLCQNPANPSIMYAATGEATSNADAVLGKGIWKSTNAGLTWTLLPSTANLIRNYRVLCDNAGNVYVASRTTAAPAVNTSGLLRSKDGGATWENITPTAQGTATATATCTDIEISSTGKLYASFGYLGTVVRAYVSSDPANVTQASGWTLGTGIRIAAVSAVRMELAALADTVYAVTVNSGNNTDSCYKSIDGGVTWTKQNTTVIPSGLGSGQGWYNQTLAINPANSNELISGGLDAYRSTNAGATWTRHTFWVTTAPYVHADHHFVQWWYKNGESRILIGCDGGLFLTRDNGVSWKDKNRNLSIKQFYGAAIHPAAGSPYLLAGAQDNGTHQLKYPGLGPSIEVTGGDGAYTYINQLDPNIQFGAYVYNQYRRSTNGGQTWTAINPSTTIGLFINPFDYDDAQNILYACYSANNILRWPNANTANTTTTVAIAALNGAQASALKVSPYTANRLFLGSNGGRVLRVDNANATPTVTNITGPAFTAGFINCVNVGTSDDVLVATYTNYGVTHVWFTNDGGANWTAIDGNLPNMPVRWALFEPGRNDRMFLATDAGIYSTDLINGASTVWAPNTTFPTVRTDMLKMRTSDSTIVASTHGRGLFTAKIPAVVLPQVTFLAAASNVTEQTISTTGCRSYADYTVKIGLVNPAVGDAVVNLNVSAGNTALRGADFDFTTNGSFTAPSSQLTFASGTTGVKEITVRIYDDAEIESIEDFTLGYTVSGTTTAVAGLITSHKVSIADNDRYPIPFGTNSYTVGINNADITGGSPFRGTKLKHRSQLLYYASEIRSSGITVPAVISALRLRVKTKNSTQPFNGLTISMANTNASTVGAGYVTGVTYTQVYSGNYSTVAGNNDFAFATPFNWDGVSNIVIQLCYDNTGATADAADDVMEGTATPLGTGIRGSVYSDWTTAPGAGCALAAALVSDSRATAAFTATFGDAVATALNSNKTQYQAGSTDLYYYTNSGEILARVLNLSNHDYGCTQVQINRAGTGTSQFWNTNTANYLMNKTFRIVPSTNNTGGKNEVTFYFTKAEKEGWEAATGRSWSNIQIIKVPSSIANVTPLNAQPDGTGTVQVISGVTRTFGPNYYTLSAVFENGFAAYGFGIPERMNTILTLTGQINSNGKDIDLAWTTSVEINSSVFSIEKSYDGVNYRSIGNRQAAGNKLTSSNYTFTDPENTLDNYYRIKMQHTDGYVLYSNVVYIKKDNAPQRILVFPNPFVNDLSVRLGRTSTGPVTFSFFDASGKLVKRFTQPGGAATYNINTAGIIAKGIYTLKVNVDGKQFAQQVYKKE